MAGTILTPVEASDVQAASEVHQLDAVNPMIELGTSGLKRSGGYVDEEFLPNLRGRKAAQVYREMGDNDPITGALLFSIMQLLRGVDYTVVPGGKSAEHAKAARFVETSMEDMSSSWDDTIMEILTCLRHGWSWHEVVYKRRGGPWAKDARERSKYSDGLISWRKMPGRGQDTLHRWVFDDSGDVQAMVQLAPPDYVQRTIPISRSLLFRFGHHKNSPEGISILRNSYRPWYYKKRLEEFESVGVERDLAGLPIVYVPSDYLRAKPGSEAYKMVEAMKKMVRSVRRNEQEGLVFPLSYDEETKQPQFKFELLSSGGSRQHDTNALIQRYEQRQLMTVLADFIMVGHQGSTGTYNLHVDKTGIFRDALNATAGSICDVFNRHAIPRLFAINGWRMEALPQIQPGNVDAPDLGQLAQFLTATAGLGFSWGPDADMEKFLRHAAGMPELGQDEINVRRKEARVDEAARFAEQQARLLAARSQLAQAYASEEALAAGEHTPETQAAAMQQAQGQQQMQIAGANEDRTARQSLFDRQAQLSQMNNPDPTQDKTGAAARGKR